MKLGWGDCKVTVGSHYLSMGQLSVEKSLPVAFSRELNLYIVFRFIVQACSRDILQSILSNGSLNSEDLPLKDIWKDFKLNKIWQLIKKLSHCISALLDF